EWWARPTTSPRATSSSPTSPATSASTPGRRSSACGRRTTSTALTSSRTDPAGALPSPPPVRAQRSEGGVRVTMEERPGKTLTPPAPIHPHETMTFLLALLLSFGPALGCAGIVYWLDRYEKEPAVLLGAVFGWGAIVAIAGAVVAELTLEGVTALATGSQ